MEPRGTTVTFIQTTLDYIHAAIGTVFFVVGAALSNLLPLELLRKFDDKCIDGQYGRINDEEV